MEVRKEAETDDKDEKGLPGRAKTLPVSYTLLLHKGRDRLSTVCRGLRGATRAEDNSREAILSATGELLERLVEENDLRQEQIAAALFTTTRDLNAEFPAMAARQMGWNNVALMDAQEIDVPGALSRCIRVMLIVNIDKGAGELVNVYLQDTDKLRLRGVEA
jgi:chorismate mutase